MVYRNYIHNNEWSLVSALSLCYVSERALVWSLVANRDTGRSRLYSPRRDAMRDLLSLRSAVEYLINAATKPKGAHTTESCNFIAIRLLYYTELLPIV